MSTPVLIGITGILSLVLLAWGLVQAIPSSGTRTVKRRLKEVRNRTGGQKAAHEEARRRRRRQRLQQFLETVGQRLTGEDEESRESVRKRLVRAGYRHPNALAIFMASRVVLAVGMGLASLSLAGVWASDPSQAFLWVAFGGLLGWMLPYIVLKRKVKARKSELQNALPDALDLMVVCVEAGLGVNQALQRVADEIDRVSDTMSEELTLVSTDIRAGTSRSAAQHDLGERTGLLDAQDSVSMRIQTERFGTSVADALRIHADELRDKRRQRAEEEAAKAGVKILIPLVLFLLPAIFVVLVGPAIFPLMEAFGNM
jgi:tight adherence protein C